VLLYAKDRLYRNAATFSAAAALAGSAVGGITSMLSTVFVQRAQVLAQRIAEQKSKLQRLYGDFIDEASVQNHDIVDPLRSFSESCRAELRDLSFHSSV